MKKVTGQYLDSLTFEERQKVCVFNRGDLKKIINRLDFNVAELQKQFFFFNPNTEELYCTGWVPEDNLSYCERGVLETMRWNDYQKSDEQLAWDILEDFAVACQQRGFTPLFCE